MTSIISNITAAQNEACLAAYSLPRIIKNITDALYESWVVALALITLLLIIALCVAGLIAALSPEQRKNALFKNIAYVLLVCVLIGTSSTIVGWALTSGFGA